MMQQKIEGHYEGYIWMSDATQPEVIHADKAFGIVLDDHANPFIIEGELYDSAHGESVSIRFADGRYYVSHFHVDEADLKGSAQATPKEYLAQRMPGVGKLKFLQYWNVVSDSLCEDMETLQPGSLVFVGFKGKEEP